MRTVSRRAGRGVALALCIVLLAACGGNEPPSSGPEEDRGPDLAAGLLPSDAFGPEAAVSSITREQLEQGAGLAAAGQADLEITPEACAAAVEGTQPRFDEFEDVVAQSATTGS